MRPVLHDSLPVPVSPETWSMYHHADGENGIDPDVEPFIAGYPHLITQPK